MNATPRTDAEFRECGYTWTRSRDGHDAECDMVPVYFAQELERELAAARDGLSEGSSKWIPVGERKPKPEMRVMTYTTPTPEMLAARASVEPSPGNTKAEAIDGIAAFDWTISQWIEYEGNGWWSPDGQHPPTHWMPLPEAPQS